MKPTNPDPWICEYRRMVVFANRSVRVGTDPKTSPEHQLQTLLNDPTEMARTRGSRCPESPVIALGPWLESQHPTGNNHLPTGALATPGASADWHTGQPHPIPDAGAPGAHRAILAAAQLETCTTTVEEPRDLAACPDLDRATWQRTGTFIHYVSALTDVNDEPIPIPDPLRLTSVKRIYIETLVPHFAVVDVRSLRTDTRGAFETALANDGELTASWEGATPNYVTSFGRAGTDPWSEEGIPDDLRRSAVIACEYPS